MDGHRVPGTRISPCRRHHGAIERAMFNIRREQALFYAARAHALSELFRDLEIQLRNEEDWYRNVDEKAKDNEPFHKQLGLIVAASRAVERAKGQTTMREDKAAR